MSDGFEEYCLRLEQVAIKVTRRVGHEVSALLEEGMSSVQLIVLNLLDRSGGMKVSDIAEYLGVTLSAVSSICDRLATARLITRERDEGDRRLVWLRLTDVGRAKVVELEAKRLDLMRRYLGKMPREDMDRLLEILDRLATIMDEVPSTVES